MATTPFTSPAVMKHSPSVMEHFFAPSTKTVGGSNGTVCTTPPTITSPGSSIGASSCNNNGNTAKMITALKWMTAIQEATQCLRNQPSKTNDKNNRGRHSIEATEHALKYLVKLETLLKPLEAEWDQAPPMEPPAFEPYKVPVKKTSNNNNSKNTNNKKKKNNRGRSSSVNKSPTSIVFTPKTPPGFQNKTANRFASLFDDDDDDDESVTGTPTTCSLEGFEDLHEAGDVPTLNRIAEFPTGAVMATRRLMIRIVTAQSELFAYQACGYRKLSNWSLAAETCHASLWKIHQGLLLADSEISRCLSEGGTLVERQPLMEDAAVVEVAVKSLTQERELFVQKALAKKHQLIRQLEKAYIARNKARLAMGEEKWNSNKKRTSTSHSSQRGIQEHMLVEIELALDHILTLDTRALAYSADQLKVRLQYAPPPTGYLTHRHNNKQRPSDYVAKRVSYDMYPDPSHHDWIFTGSFCENGKHKEFYEKQGMLLDFDFVTGEVELSWMHLSRHGNTTFYRSAGPTPTALYKKLVASPTPWTVAEEHKKMQAAMPGNTTMGARNRW